MSAIDRITTAVNDMLQTALGVSLLDMFIQISATIILVIIVKKFFWGKITAFLEKRGEILSAELQTLENAKSKALELETMRQTEYTELQRQKSQVIQEARKIGEAEKEAILLSAKHEALRIAVEANLQLEYDIQKAKEALTEEVVVLAAQMATKIIQAEVDPSKYTEQVSKEFLKRES
ncbi:MAG: F0F1 ATP synthase subunit B [Candidatus Izemoplasmatales bacterium]|jgi:F-type H+-transporting ATPase subunit b|nr:F0F1 ATP synthase subunit B [bacterium]MDZ4196707.1 F0F1 ATP synthase subunit B [Candidatus Izemoplasmatales bacterium]